MLTAGGLLIWLAGRTGWQASFTAGTAVLAILAVAALALPAPERPAGRTPAIWEPLRALLVRKDIWAVVAFALLFKLDIAALEPMTRPFWVDRGLSLTEIGAVLTTGRIVATIAGAALGGVFTSRWGIFRGLWVLGLVQALSSLGYWAAATTAASGAADRGRGALRELRGRSRDRGVPRLPDVGLRETLRGDAVRAALGPSRDHPGGRRASCRASWRR